MIFLPRMATKDSSDSEIACFEKVVFLKGLETVFGTSRVESTDFLIT